MPSVLVDRLGWDQSVVRRRARPRAGAAACEYTVLKARARMELACHWQISARSYFAGHVPSSKRFRRQETATARPRLYEEALTDLLRLVSQDVLVVLSDTETKTIAAAARGTLHSGIELGRELPELFPAQGGEVIVFTLMGPPRRCMPIHYCRVRHLA